MEIEVVAIGDEVLSGYTVNKNAAQISQALLEAGFLVKRHQVVGDEKMALKSVLAEALLKGVCVITTGGLGPTCDDYTREIVCELFHTELEFRQELFLKNTELFGKACEAENQALQPKGAHLLKNELGTASGFVLKNEKLFPKAMLLALPGVPSEMRAMLGEVIGFLKQEKQTTRRLYVKPLHFIKLKEVEVDPLLRKLAKEFPDLQFGIYPAYGKLSVHIKAYAENKTEFQQKSKIAQEAILKEFQYYYYESENGKVEEALHALFQEKKLKFATAESCTGGALACCFTSQSSASRYFQGSVIAYANQVKEEVLHVKKETLEKYGAVSIEVTSEMALGVAQALHADCAVAVSGILGPEGGTIEKPVGTVAASIFLKGEVVASWVMHHPRVKPSAATRLVLLEKTVQAVLAELMLRIRCL
jgi:nicotinamide-nucleotide amidase